MQLRVVWFAILVSQLVFPLILWATPGRPGSAPGPVVLVLLGVAALEATLSLIWGRLVAKAPTEARWFIRWAFAEAVTLSGFTLGFLGGPLDASAVLMAVGALLVLVQWPREEDSG